jgi:hypothetical protein
MANGHGGVRANAGRKKGFAALAGEKMREKVAKELEEQYEQLWRPQFDKAVKGDTGAFREIREFAFGKPQTFTDLTTDGESLVKNDIKELSDDELASLAFGSQTGISET